MKEDKGYGIITIYKGTENLFLLLKHQKGHWGFPKGHKEGNETPLESATRELREESGISNCEIKESPIFFEEYTFKDEGISCHKIVEYFIGFSPTQEVVIQEKEISEYKWATYDEVLNLSNSKRAITEVVEYLKIHQ